MRKAMITAVTTAALLMFYPVGSPAMYGIGFQGGGGVDPGMGTVGAHWFMPTRAVTDQVWFNLMTTLDAGFGDFGQVCQLDPGLTMPIRLHPKLNVYPLAAVGIVFWNFDLEDGIIATMLAAQRSGVGLQQSDRGIDFDIDGDKTQVKVGAVLGGGAEYHFSRALAVFGQVKAGIGDIPELRFTVGLTFWRNR